MKHPRKIIAGLVAVGLLAGTATFARAQDGQPTVKHHAVQQGQSWASIAATYGMTANELGIANGVKWQNSALFLGRVLHVVPNVTALTPTTATPTSATPTSATPTTAKPTTATPTTATPTPTTTAQPSTTTPGGTAPQFVARFDTAADLDKFDWEVRHGAPNDPSLTPSWQGDHDHACGTPYTLRPVTQVPGDVAPGPVANVGNLAYWCRGHMMTSMVTTGYGHLDFSPRQNFNDVSKVCWDQNFTQVGRKWTQVAVIPEDLIRANGGSLAYTMLALQVDVGAAAERVTGNAWMLINGAGGSEVQIGQQMTYQNFDTGGLLGSQDKARRFRNCAIDQGDGTVRLELERFGGTVIRNAPGSFPDGPVRVIFQDVTYDAPKGPPFQTVLQQNTWHWDNIEVW